MNTPMPASSLFTRIMLTLGAISVAGFTFWFLYTSLSPVEVPLPPPTRGALRFDTKADLSQDQRFTDLQALVNDFNIEPGTLGRANPFMPLPPPVQEVFVTTTATSTPETPTSTNLENPPMLMPSDLMP